MTPKEKAEELFDKYYDYTADMEHPNEFAKQCAIIAVDEILINSVGYNAYDGVINNDIWADDEYWQEVKQEIEKL